jgi:hypothetical protein
VKKYTIFTANVVSSVCRLLVTANVVSTSPILVTLMMEALGSFETSVLKRATRRNIPEYEILLLINLVRNSRNMKAVTENACIEGWHLIVR